MSTRLFRNRRKVLKISGTGVGFLSVSSTAAARESADDGTKSDKGITWEIVRETEHFTLVKVTDVDSPEKGAYLFRVDNEDGTVSLVDKADNEQSLSIPSNSNVVMQSHDEWLSDMHYAVDKSGNCNGYVYDDHLVAGLAIETGESLNTYKGELSFLIGGLIGGRVGGAPGAALGALLGVVIDSTFISHIDMSGRWLTILLWDDHVGWLNEEAIRCGIVPGYFTDTDPKVATHTKKVSGPHLELGEDVSNYL